MVRIIAPTLVIVGALLLPLQSTAQPAEWTVASSSERESKVVSRYVGMLVENPDRTSILRLLQRRTGTGPALERLISSLRDGAKQRANVWILVGHLELGRDRNLAAIECYEEAVRLAPSSATAHASLGQGLSRSGDSVRASQEFERALELSSEPGKRTLLRRLADLASTAGDDLAAANWLARLAERSPTNRSLLIELADAQQRARRYDLSLETHQRVVELSRGGKARAEALIELARLHLRMQNAHDAEEKLEQALSLIARGGWMRREAWSAMIEAARHTGRLADVYERLTREWSRPELRDAFVLADLADELGRGDDALTWIEAAVRAEPSSIEARRRLIARLDPVKDASRIDKLYQGLIARSPEDVAEQIERIEWLFFRGQRPGEALEALRSLEKEVGEDAEQLVAVAQAWLRFGVPDVALRIHAGLEETSPKNPRHLEAYADLLLDLGRQVEAFAVLNRLVATSPAKVATRLRAAELAVRHKALDFGAAQLEAVVAEAPELLDVRQRLAAVYETQERWPEALRAWEVVFDAGKDHAAAPIIAILHRTVFIGDTTHSPDAQALARWEARFHQEPNVRTGEVLIEARKASGTPAAAKRLVEELIARDPATLPRSDRQPWFRIAQRHREHLDVRQTLALLERMAAAFAEWRSMLLHESVTLAAQLPKDEAEAAFAGLLERAPHDAYVWAAVGLYWSSHDDELRALTHLRRARALNPQLTTASFELVFVLRKLGQDDEAWDVLIDMLHRTRSKAVTLDVAFNALDLATTDAQLLELERMLPTLEGRVGSSELTAVAVAVYYALYMHSGDVDVFRQTRERAVRHVVAALASTEPGDVALASELVERFDAGELAAEAKKRWPADGSSWSPAMVALVATEDSPWLTARFTEATRSPDRRVVRLAATALGLHRSTSAVPQLTEVFQRRDFGPRERNTIAASLGRIDVAPSRAVLREHVKSAEWEERQIAIWGLGQGRSAEAASSLSELLSDKDDAVARLAAVMLRQSRAGVRALLAASWAADAHVRHVAEHGLRAPRVSDWWTEVPNDLHQVESGLYARRFSIANTDAKEPLIAALHGHEELVGELLREDVPDPALELLARMADEVQDEPQTRSMRKVVIGLRPQLRRLARGDDGSRLAKSALLLPWAQRWEDAPLVVAALERAPLGQRPQIVRRLGHYRWRHVRSTLLTSMNDTSAERRAAAMRALAAFREASRDPEVLEVARQTAANSRDDGQLAAIEILRDAKHADSADMLAGAFERSGPRARVAIREALGAIGTPKARGHLRALKVEPELPVCAGDPNDLTALLADDCRGAVATPEF